MKEKLLWILLFFPVLTFAQQLVYKPINPAFGGETFNHQWLLNAANAQNSFKDPDFEDRFKRSQMEEFAEGLNRQILSQISRSLFNSQLGDGLEPGIFNFGTMTIEIYETGDGMVINILDTTTGEETQIIVPN